MRWLLYGDVKSRHAVDALIGALERAGQEVAEIPATGRGFASSPIPRRWPNPRAQSRPSCRLTCCLNLRPEQLTPDQIAGLRAKGVTTLVWLADDPLLFRVSYKHVAAAYDVTLHSARGPMCWSSTSAGLMSAAIRFRSGPTTRTSPTATTPMAPTSRSASWATAIASDVRTATTCWRACRGRPGSSGRCRRGPSTTREINAGYLAVDEMPSALRRFRVGISMAQTFVGVRDQFSFKALERFGEYWFPSRLVLYAAVGIPDREPRRCPARRRRFRASASRPAVTSWWRRSPG